MGTFGAIKFTILKNGEDIWMKRLEEDRFHWPASTGELRELSEKELQWILDGLDISKLKPHESKRYLSVI